MCIHSAFFRKNCLAFCSLILTASTVFADGLSLTSGIYDNTHQLIVISDSLPSQKIWKTFNTFWYDGPHSFPSTAAVSSPVAQIGNDLFLDFCIRYGNGDSVSGVWLPGGNCRQLTITEGSDIPARKTRLSGWYISEKGAVWQIPFWQVDADYNPGETASFTYEDDGRTVTVLVQKMVQVGGLVYTCATGRSTVIRNPQAVEPGILEKALLSSDAQVLSFSEPVYSLLTSDSSQLDAIITARNTEIHPPRFLWISPREPAIYSVIEQMPPHITPDLDHPLN